MTMFARRLQSASSPKVQAFFLHFGGLVPYLSSRRGPSSNFLIICVKVSLTETIEAVKDPETRKTGYLSVDHNLV